MGEDEFIGYTLHFACQQSLQKVAAHLHMRASLGGKFRYNLHMRPSGQFLFMKVKTKTTDYPMLSKNAMMCFLKKDDVVKRHSVKICFHRDETTVVDNLVDTMVLANDRSDCSYYLPGCERRQVSRSSEIAATAGSDTESAMSDVSVDSEATAGSDTQRDPNRFVGSDPYDYSEAYPTLCLTPTLLRENNGLLNRGETYYIGSQLIASDRGNVYIGLMGGVFVSIKDLGKDALQGTARDRTIREVFTLESGRDRGACFPRILDAFTKCTAKHNGFYVVFEVYGIPMDQFRTVHGYGREDAQPLGHIRKMCFDCCRALYYLHDTLCLLHTDVTLANIIVKALPASMAGAISCRLGGFTLLEEACLPSFIGGGSTGRSVRDRVTLHVPRANG